MAFESADGDLDSALDSILGSVSTGSAEVVPNDIQVNSISNMIGPDAARPVMEDIELEETDVDLTDEDDDKDIEDISKTKDLGSSNLSYDYDDDELIDMAISGIE